MFFFVYFALRKNQLAKKITQRIGHCNKNICPTYLTFYGSDQLSPGHFFLKNLKADWKRRRLEMTFGDLRRVKGWAREFLGSSKGDHTP